MPSKEMNIIYCTEVDNDGRVIGTSMIVPSNARCVTHSTTALLKIRKEN